MDDKDLTLTPQQRAVRLLQALPANREVLSRYNREIEEKINYISPKEYLLLKRDVEITVESLRNLEPQHREILFRRFCKKENPLDIQFDLGISHSTYYRQLRKALHNFSTMIYGEIQEDYNNTREILVF